MKKLFVIIWVLLGFYDSAWAQKALSIEQTIVHDPVMIKQGDTYYLFCTGRGISIFSSKDMKSWTPQKQIFENAPTWVTPEMVPDFKNHIWAPDVVYHNNQYYVYYSCSAFAKNTSAIGVVTNKTLDPKSPDYKWVDHGPVVISVPNRDMWNAIDPNIAFDENNEPWMAFGSFWDGMKMVKLNKDLTKVAQPEQWVTLARRERSFNLADTDPGDAAIEAPFIFKKGEYYYLFVSWDYCCRGEKSTYKVVVGRSKTMAGPYLDKDGKDLFYGGGSLIIEGNKNWAGVGHNSAYTFDGKDYLIFHAYDSNDKGAPKLKIKEMSWKDGWPSVSPMN